MGCIYEDNMEGFCTLSLDDDGLPDKKNKMQGCSDDGFCVVLDDPQPSDNCDMYETDYPCYDCGADLNIEECTCVDEDE